MSSNQEAFDDFPHDDAFWVVKYIDQFHQAHLHTRSTAVMVMLQRLPPMSLEQLVSLTVGQCQELLGRRRNDAWPQIEFVEMLVGGLPLLSIGMVFRNGVKAGEMPRQRKVLSLLPFELDTEEFEAGQEISRPPGWGQNLPYRILNSFEYAGVFNHASRNIFFSKSRLVTFTRRVRGGKEIYVIPRMTIFKAFYAQHIEIAKAICAGPWSRALEQVICLNDLDSGLKTEAVSDGTQWNIILRTLVPDDYAGLLAVLFFDRYGRGCAESIYTKSLQDRQGNPRSPWFASAQIPIQVFTGHLNLTLKSIELRSWRYLDAEGEKSEIKKFLVTEISGCSWPAHYPEIGVSRTNDGTDSPDPEPVQLAKPYRAPPKSKEGNQSTTITQGEDANLKTSTTTMKGSEWSWTDGAPVVRKLQKLHSKKYQGEPRFAPDEDGTLVSAGAHTHEKEALPKAEAKTLVRVPNARFEHIVHIMGQLKQDGVIAEIIEVAPRHPRQMSDRSGFKCWKFIDAESLQNGKGPRPGWRAIYPSSGNRRNANYRTALILALDSGGATHYWIEIECRDGDGFRSVLLSGLKNERHSALEATLDVIAEAKGRQLKAKLDNAFAYECIRVATYRHHYDEERKQLTKESVQKFLTSAFQTDCGT